MTRALPLGVLEAENKREAKILAEHMRSERRVIDEMHDLHIYFLSPNITQGQVDDTKAVYEGMGMALRTFWIFDENGNRRGVEIHGRQPA